jgi:hypothetical protein
MQSTLGDILQELRSQKSPTTQRPYANSPTEDPPKPFTTAAYSPTHGQSHHQNSLGSDSSHNRARSDSNATTSSYVDSGPLGIVNHMHGPPGVALSNHSHPSLSPQSHISPAPSGSSPASSNSHSNQQANLYAQNNGMPSSRPSTQGGVILPPPQPTQSPALSQHGLPHLHSMLASASAPTYIHQHSSSSMYMHPNPPLQVLSSLSHASQLIIFFSAATVLQWGQVLLDPSLQTPSFRLQTPSRHQAQDPLFLLMVFIFHPRSTPTHSHRGHLNRIFQVHGIRTASSNLPDAWYPQRALDTMNLR